MILCNKTYLKMYLKKNGVHALRLGMRMCREQYTD